MPKKISQLEREVQLSALALADGYEFVGWVGEYVNGTSKAVINCRIHGEWSATFDNFTRGTRCPGCANDKRCTPHLERELQLRTLATKDGFTFMRWTDNCSRWNSKAVIRCKDHGEWSVTVGNFVDGGKRCPGCGYAKRATKRRTPKIECEFKIAKLAENDGFAFVGWDGEYKNCDSKAIINCVNHGTWSASVDNLMRGKRCPGCAVTGYASNKPGTLYALLSDCGSMIKIGISNQSKRRYTELRSSTPFKFSVYREIHCEDGSVPPSLEKLFHSQFPSADQRGFSGATEWRQMNPDITTWLELLA